MKPRRSLLLVGILSLALVLGSTVLAQRMGRSRRPMRSAEPPAWTNAPGFEKDVFTFVRIEYSGGQWDTDYPDAEHNFAFRLQQMTSMKVDPVGRVLRLEDPELFRHPFIYIVEPGRMEFSTEEAAILRRYLLNGGFLMVDDFWGDDEWNNLAAELKRVFPDRRIIDLPRTHAIFHCVFDIPNDLNLQLPSIGEWYPGGVTWERRRRYKEQGTDAHFRGILDDKGRLCVIICHNTDNGDGWEREGENQQYFREFSEKKAYPMGINIIFYAMTH